MDQFLNSIAKYYHQDYKTKLNKICFVFPGRRAGLFFQKYLAELVKEEDGAIFLPKIISIEHFCEELSGVESADNLLLMFELYDLYNATMSAQITFDAFYQIGETLLSDFDDIDKYLVDAKTLFTNIGDISELTDNEYSYLSDDQKATIAEFWKNFRGNQANSDNNSSFHTLFLQLPKLYKQFRINLLNKKLGYEGLIQRQIVDKITQKEGIDLKFEKYAFIGFNALNKCEIKLFDYLKNLKKADFFWDYSTYLIESNNIGGKYIIENLKNFPPPFDWQIPQPSDNEIIDDNKKAKFNIVSVASSATQTQVFNHVLKEIDKDAKAKYELIDPIDIGIILADESLLLPTLYSIPDLDIYKDINVTMGYPIKNSSITALINQVVLLNKNRSSKGDEISYYYKNLLPIFDHSIFSSFSSINIIQSIKNKILKHNIIRVKDSFLISEIVSITTNPEEQKKAIDFVTLLLNRESLPLSDYLLNLLHFLYSNEEMIAKLDKEFIYHHYKTIVRINSILHERNVVLDNNTWLRIYNKLTSRLSVPFAGEPLNGLQIMGIMETRALDFKQLVILSLNENIFPKGSRPNSFILYNLRKGFGLPTIEHRDSIFAYYLFRLLNRVERVHLVYSSANSDSSSANEMSRFLYQIKYHFTQDVKHYTGVETTPNSTSVEPILISKNESVKQQLNNIIESEDFKIFPTQLEKYLQCKLSYYFASILKLKEADEVTEEFDNRILGQIFHKALEFLYSNEINKVITADDLKHIWSSERRHKVLIEAFEHIQKTDKLLNEETGFKELIFKVLAKYMNGMYQIEKQRVPFVVNSLEQQYSFKTTLSNQKQITLSGHIDRIDIKDNKIEIIDYKTGEAEHKIKKITDLFDNEFDSKNKSVFQTLFYCMIYGNQPSIPKMTIQPAVFAVKSLFKQSQNNKDITLEYVTTKTKKGEEIDSETPQFPTITYANGNENVKGYFDAKVMEIIEEIYISDTPFSQTKVQKTCSICAYKSICMR